MNTVKISGTVQLSAMVQPRNDDSIRLAAVHIESPTKSRLLGDLLAEVLCRGLPANDKGRVYTEGLARISIVIEPVAPLDVRVAQPGREEERLVLAEVGAPPATDD